ncbi:hypothetical protein KAT24_02290 [Candidatus Pacearchaeota archaeon]|nr:hypothetical protein [Candidatus Pacearchaeota archaeon]
MVNKRFLEIAERWMDEGIPKVKEKRDVPEPNEVVEKKQETNLKKELIYVTPGNTIFWHRETGEEIVIGKRNFPISKIYVHKGQVYDTGTTRIFETLTGKEIGKGRIHDLCSHNGRLYHTKFLYGNSGIFETLTGRKITSRIARNLCSHGGQLYDVGEEGIFETLTGRQISSRRNDRPMLCSHDGKLYDRGKEGIFETLTGKQITSRGSPWWNSLCSYRGQLYDGGDGGVFETLTGKQITPEGREGFCLHNGKLYGTYRGELLEVLIGKRLRLNHPSYANNMFAFGQDVISGFYSIDSDLVNKMLENNS